MQTVRVQDSAVTVSKTKLVVSTRQAWSVFVGTALKRRTFEEYRKLPYDMQKSQRGEYLPGPRGVMQCNAKKFVLLIYGFYQVVH